MHLPARLFSESCAKARTVTHALLLLYTVKGDMQEAYLDLLHKLQFMYSGQNAPVP